MTKFEKSLKDYESIDKYINNIGENIKNNIRA